MNGQAKPLVKYLDGSDTRFIIPVYQRNYDWKIDNCRQLYDVYAKDRVEIKWKFRDEFKEAKMVENDRDIGGE